MRCSRCSGLMVEGLFLDVEGCFRYMWAASWSCVNCGQVHDSLSEQNHLSQQTKASAPPSGEPDYQDDEVHLGAEAFVNKGA
jgi:hypothetical protein